jgi:hypothetical protein
MSPVLCLYLQETKQVSTAASSTNSKGDLHTGDQLQGTDKQLALPATEFPHEFRCVRTLLLGRVEMSSALLFARRKLELGGNVPRAWQQWAWRSGAIKHA